MPDKKYGEIAIEEAKLETWPSGRDRNDHARDYSIDISFPEFTCKCPRSGYPDFATVRITYRPKDKVVELKTLKLWLNAYRDVGISHENATNDVFEALRDLLEPNHLRVEFDFLPRGNVHTVIVRETSF